ncbi:MAG: hypothetical protein JNM94_05540 [Phycisphaerae bacterium]|nr:hypothetical protein [Phycisphaerae bacterium]
MRITNRPALAAAGTIAMTLAAAVAAPSDPPPAGDAATPPAATPVAIPAQVDLRETLKSMGLPPREQGARGTCSIFTTCASIEFALAKYRGKAERLSPEYLNWAASQALGRPSDGNFFHNALAGFETHGICSDAAMPYQPTYDASRVPSSAAAAEAARVKKEAASALQVHWIIPWKPDRFGVGNAEFDAIKSVLARGYPVAAGAGHSRLLVGYRDDASKPGGGVFLTLDSGLGRFDEVTYEFVRKEVADVFWIEAVTPSPAAAPSRETTTRDAK